MAVKSQQLQKFRAKARELDCDESEAAFDMRLSKIAPALEEKGPPPKPARRKATKTKAPE